MHQREDRRSSERRRSATLLRRLAAAFVLLLLSWQGVAPAAATSRAPARDAGYATSARSMDCARAAGEAEHPRRHGDDAQCCAFCGARGFDEALALGPCQADGYVLRQRPPIRSRIARHAAIGAPTPAGWRSSWSSRAPPVRA
ncbi:hypothetical protein [Methylosinus sp. LW3]|uniref:hypothetical protein n=1 Tax=Methylosinus sp. LW3 TaxID=107635 RepID=UPI00046579A8|nr:hypothetical protein [Methylosinus sp. LW3]